MRKFGTISVALGAVALVAAIAATEVDRLRSPGIGYLLNWMDRLGLIKESDPKQVPEWRPLGLFDLTDDRALKLTVVFSFCFAVSAMLIALFAQRKREETLWLSIGFVLGAMALHIHGFQYSLPALAVGAVLHALILRRQRPNPSIERDVQGLSPSAAPHVKR